jgi:hypothetical protein
MATRKLTLGSAASLFLGSAVIAAGPVLAQSGDPARAYSTAKAQYESELRDYTQKQQAYEQERSEYNAKIADYQRSLSEPLPEPAPDVVVVDDPDPDVVVVDPDRDTTVVVAPDRDTTIVIDRPDDPTVVVRDPDADDVVVVDDFADRLLIPDVPPLMRVEDVADANYELFNMPVLDSAGLPVGHFRRIEVKQPGDLVAVVTLNSRRTISVLTDHVRFDPGSMRIIADLTARELDLIPSGFPYG